MKHMKKLFEPAKGFTAYWLVLAVLMACLLAPGTAQAQSEQDVWAQAEAIVASIVVPEFPDRDFVITDYGAKPGGEVKNTEAIAKAIAACHEAGGGRVVVPAGEWLTGAIHLKSNVNLHVTEDATLLFSTEPADYLPVVYTRWEGVECMNYSALIYAFEQENIAVTGKGTLDGQATVDNWWPWKGQTAHGWKQGMKHQAEGRKRMFDMGMAGVPVEERIMGDGAYLRPNFFQPYRCKNVLISDVTILRSPMWQLNPVLCENVTVRGLTIISHGPNNDGCNPESSRNVLIENCLFDTGDDCIALKSGRNNDGRRIGVPVENVVIRNCHMKEGHGGVVIGSEISGGARNIFAENCTMDSPDLERMLRIKTNSVRGGVMENIHLRNIVVGQVSDALFRVNFFYEEGDADNFTPTVRNISMTNIIAKQSNYGLYLRGYERSLVRDVKMTNVIFDNLRRGNMLENVEGFEFTNVIMNGQNVTSLETARDVVNANALPTAAPPASALEQR